MRMWGVEPKFLCRKHLLGEHVEMHMFRGVITRDISVKGYLDNKLVTLGNIKKRHDELVKEMEKRHFNHKSPLKEFNEGKGGVIDIEGNKNNLMCRCKECKNNFINGGIQYGDISSHRSRI